MAGLHKLFTGVMGRRCQAGVYGTGGKVLWKGADGQLHGRGRCVWRSIFLSGWKRACGAACGQHRAACSGDIGGEETTDNKRNYASKITQGSIREHWRRSKGFEKSGLKQK